MSFPTCIAFRNETHGFLLIIMHGWITLLVTVMSDECIFSCLGMEPSQGKKTATVNPVLRQLTNDDTKVLGKDIKKKRDKHLPPDKFTTRNYKHLNSSWTPVNHKPSNETVSYISSSRMCNFRPTWIVHHVNSYDEVICWH